MNRTEFIQIFDGVRSQRKYSNIEMERIFHHVKWLQVGTFRKIVNKFLDAGVKPNVADFKNQAQSFSNHKTNLKNKPREIPSECQYCMDSGLVEILMDGSIKVFAHCFCNRNKFHSNELATHPSEQTIVGKYIGPGVMPFQPGVDSPVESMKFYRQKIFISEQYWKQQTKGKNNE